MPYMIGFLKIAAKISANYQWNVESPLRMASLKGHLSWQVCHENDADNKFSNMPGIFSRQYPQISYIKYS